MGNTGSIRVFAGFRGDYQSDQIIRIFGVCLFIILAVVINLQMSRDGAVTCWTPAYFTNQHEIFTNSMCKMESTGKSTMKSFNEEGPVTDDSMSVLNFSRMRCFPIVLALQSLLFFIPWLLWRQISGGVCCLDSVIKEASYHKNPRSESGISICANIKQLLLEPCSFLGSTGGGFILSLSYLFTKFFYWIICIIQMAVISSYFDINFFTFKTGHYLWEPYTYTNFSDVIEIYENVTTVSTTNETVTPFPRLVFCNFEVQVHGNRHRHEVQCTVDVAETIEHCLTLIWICLILALVITSLSGAAQFLHLILRCTGPFSHKNSLLTKRLSRCESFNLASPEVIQKFSALYLKPDLFFVMGMIEENGSISASFSALMELWEDFLKASKIQITPKKQIAEDARPLVEDMYPADREHGHYTTTELQPHFNDAEAKL